MTNTFHFPSILKIIAGTPIWVWGVFAYLIFVGIKASKQRVVYIPKLFIIPVILSALKYKIFLSASFSVYLSYFACLALGMMIGFKIAQGQKFETLNNLQVKLPGDYSTISILMTFFVIKYIFGYINAINHELYQDLSILELSASGIFSGYFLGKASFYLKNSSKKI